MNAAPPIAIPYERLDLSNLRGSISIGCRPGVRKSTWYYRLDYPGENSVQRSMPGVTSRREAERSARAVLLGRNQSTRAAFLDALAAFSTRKVFASLGRIFAAAEAGAEINQRVTMKKNVNAVRLVVADAEGIDRSLPGWQDKVDVLPASVLTRALAFRFYAVRQRRLGFEKLNLEQEHPGNGGINSTLRNAKDLFSKRAMQTHFADLVLPDLTEFLQARTLPVPPREPPQLDPAAVAAMDAAAPALRVVDPDAWELWTVLRFSGMRPFEALGARGSWLSRNASGQWELEIRSRPDEKFRLKKGTAPGTLIVSDEVMAIFQGRDGYLVAPECSVTDRKEGIRGRLSQFMRQFFPGEDFQKSSYLLRSLAGTQRVALLRHVDPTQRVAHKHYVRPVPVPMLGTVPVPVPNGKDG